MRLGPFACLLASGCAYLGEAVPWDPSTSGPGTRFLQGFEPPGPPSGGGCGPSALAGVLRYHRDPVALDDVAAALPPGPDGGVQAGSLRDYARSRGFRAHVLEGSFEDLREQISKGRPAIVGLVQLYVDGARTHYVIVLGVESEPQAVLAWDPGRGLTRTPLTSFLREWGPSGRLLLVVSRPSR